MYTSHQVDKNTDIKMVITRLLAFSMANAGAMGCPGEILLLTDKNELYSTNVLREDVGKSVLKELQTNVFNSDNLNAQETIAPAGWKYTYLGFGNHLYMVDWLDTLFYKIVSRDTPSPCLYSIWEKISSRLIDCKQIAEANKSIH